MLPAPCLYAPGRMVSGRTTLSKSNKSVCVVLLKTCLLLFVLIQAMRADAYCIVFVHLGEKLPDYISVALAQARIFNKTAPVYLLANQSALLNHDKKIDELNIYCIAVETIPQTTEHKKYLEYTLAKKGITDGFCLYTSERFLVLYDWMLFSGLRDVVHVENDTLLYADINELLPVFKKHYPGIATTFDCDARCVPCFMYIADASAMQKSAQFFVREMAARTPRPDWGIWDINDMQTIAHFKKLYDGTVIAPLPVIMPEYAKQYELINSIGQRPENPEDYSRNIEHFNSLFDAAAIGQFLGGTYAEGKPGFISEACIFNPARLQYGWKIDSEGRRVIYVVFQNKKYRLNNLHVHSKKLAQFASREKPVCLSSTS